MIVDPDFFDHWRTRMVVDLLGGDKLAPLYVMRLWAHCQNRKGWQFSIPTAGIKALCQYEGDAQALESALIASDYLQRDGDTITVVGWEEKNASLIAAWANGSKGGRPKKETHGFPTGNPTVTHGKPTENPDETDKSREEKIEEPIGSSVGSVAKRRSRIPDGFTPNETGMAKALEKGIDVQAELQKFCDYHAAKGNVMADWQAAWRTWVGNARPASQALVIPLTASGQARSRAELISGAASAIFDGARHV